MAHAPERRRRHPSPTRAIGVLVGALVVATTACGRAAPRVAPGPGPQGAPSAIAFQVVELGGFVAPVALVARVPSITVLVDGSVITPVAGAGFAASGSLARLEVRHVPAARVRALMTEAARLGLLKPGLDFGRPGISDMPTATVRFGDGTRIVATQSAYALSFESVGDAGLSHTQLTARRALRTFVAELDALPGTRRPYTPRAVAVFTLTSSYGTGGGAPRSWPLTTQPAPATAADAQPCVVVRGAEAATLLRALTGVAVGTSWNVGGHPLVLGFRPLVTTDGACSW